MTVGWNLAPSENDFRELGARLFHRWLHVDERYWAIFFISHFSFPFIPTDRPRRCRSRVSGFVRYQGALVAPLASSYAIFLRECRTYIPLFVAHLPICGVI